MNVYMYGFMHVYDIVMISYISPHLPLILWNILTKLTL